jgi:hypothetical protein
MPLSTRKWIVFALLIIVALGAVAGVWAVTGQPTAPAATPSIPAPTPAEAEFSTPESVPNGGNPFASLLGATPAPPGWTVRPCEGDAPFLCALAGQDFIGSVELLWYSVADRSDFQQMLVEAGLEPGSPLDLGDPEHASRVLSALSAMLTDHLAAIEQDRQLVYPDGLTFDQLDPQEIHIGELPGLFYGFAGLYDSGQVYERWLTYAAFDGEVLFLVTAFFAPDVPGSFPGDEQILMFEPYLRQIVADLRLAPVPPGAGPGGGAPHSTASATPATDAGAIVVADIDIHILESFPIQVQVLVHGTLPDACAFVDQVAQTRQGSTFQVTLTPAWPADVRCAQMITPFEQIVPLEVLGLEAGTYTVDVHGVQGTFQLSMPNLPIDAGSISGRVWHDLCGVAGGEGDRPASPLPGCIEDGNTYHADGVFQAGEPGIEGVLVALGQGNCPVAGLATATTDAWGLYTFTGLEVGTYCVSIDPRREPNLGLLLPGNWTAPGLGQGSAELTLGSGAQRTDLDFGWDRQVLPTVALSWHREGGIAGFCDALTVFSTGEFQAATCDGHLLGVGRLRKEPLAQLQIWLGQWTDFEWEHTDPATADAMTIRLHFYGTGAGAASEAGRATLLDWASQWFASAASVCVVVE